MTGKKTLVDQFNRQADKFSEFSLTKNRKIFQYIFDFCGLSKDDTLLDVACGSGDFILYCADKVNKAAGVDISEGLLEIASKRMIGTGYQNVRFLCADVESLPFQNDEYTIVTCRSAFHHMSHYPEVFDEMVRCASDNGLVCIQDMIAYDDPDVNGFFEELERYVDISHNRALGPDEFSGLFSGRIPMVRKIIVESEYRLSDYLDHAYQTDSDAKKVHVLIEKGLADEKIARLLYIRENQVFFKRKGILVFGRKKG